ncbi:hypothetical protein [Roseofilum capinflatum]|uniref:Uncharacterized protein n=1 Tax=Roseofilum capinflatum BLCC-M114 TaxID=3022440 RepID=A0ABT7B6F0_9CYAN|nr:hypothetical protein [Roseofilum capinflatum]MDJ1174752.1 hypothetical protein [Roseofilum capinflatum BLCC-M114]
MHHLINALHVVPSAILTGIKITTKFLSSVAQSLAGIVLLLFHVIVNSCQWCLGKVLTFLNWTIASLHHLIMDEHTFTLSSWDIALVILSCVLLIILVRSNNTGTKITHTIIKTRDSSYENRTIKIAKGESIKTAVNLLTGGQTTSSPPPKDSDISESETTIVQDETRGLKWADVKEKTQDVVNLIKGGLEITQIFQSIRHGGQKHIIDLLNGLKNLKSK